MAIGTLTPLMASCVDAAPVAPPVPQVSANCASPSYATDHLVCEDAALRALDTETVRLWLTVEAAQRVDAFVQEAQSDWFGQRSLCAFRTDHRACAEGAYRARIAELQALV